MSTDTTPQGGTPAPIEDDLIVDLEPVQDGVPERGDDEVEAYNHVDPNLETSTLPDELEEAGGDPAPRQAERQQQERRQERAAEADDSQYQRVMAAEERARNAEANALWREAQAQAAVAEQQANTAKVALDTINLRLDGAYQELARAREVGDASAEVQIQRAIQEMAQLKGQIEASRAQIADPRYILQRAQQQAQQVLNRPVEGKRVGAGIQARHPLAERWAGSNGWMKDNSSANNFVIKQSQAMANDGWDPNSSGFYAELSRRVKVAFPHLKVNALQATQKGAAGRGTVKSPVAPTSSSSGTRPAGSAAGVGKQRYTLTAQDQAAMRRMNLDPANKKHATHFAKSRMESARRSGN